MAFAPRLPLCSSSSEASRTRDQSLKQSSLSSKFSDLLPTDPSINTLIRQAAGLQTQQLAAVAAVSTVSSRFLYEATNALSSRSLVSQFETLTFPNRQE
jgi:hypothetical protein